MKKKYTTIVVYAALVFCILCATAYAEPIVPYADSEFSRAYINLLDNKTVSVYATTYDTKDQISIDSIWLEEKVGGSWTYSTSLSALSSTVYNTRSFFFTSNYSNKIGTGTFRIGCTYDADGYKITRYSNEQSY